MVVAAAGMLLAGCEALEPEPSRPPLPPPAPTQTQPAASGPLQPSGATTVLVTGLTSPWSVVRLGDAALISERDTGQVIEFAGGSTRVAGTIPGVAPRGEGGLLGLAVLNASGERWLYAYFTSADDNRIVRFELTGSAGSLALSPGEPVLTGLAKAGNHNGGRIAFGPDGMLYATVGDAGDPGLSQDAGSYNGKILRMTPTGAVPAGNPFPGSLVWSLGHRNPQGLAWDEQGRLWSSEFGQNTWDELNLIEPGVNYGWPVVEGIAGDARFADPVLQWAPSEASPSGLASIDGTLLLASLRGQRLWVIDPAGGTAEAWFTAEFGRMRDAVPGPGGSLWVLTNNTDGRGSPGELDDRLLEFELVPVG